MAAKLGLKNIGRLQIRTARDRRHDSDSDSPTTEREKIQNQHTEEDKKAISGLRKAFINMAAECANLRRSQTEKLTFKELIS